MNRLSFFKSLGLALGAAVVVPQILLPQADDRQRWKKQHSSGLYIVNPEWVNAPYGGEFYFSVGYFAGQQGRFESTRFLTAV